MQCPIFSVILNFSYLKRSYCLSRNTDVTIMQQLYLFNSMHTSISIVFVLRMASKTHRQFYESLDNVDENRAQTQTSAVNSIIMIILQLYTIIITPSASVRNLGVIFDDQLTFKEHIAKTARSCRFALHNIRKIRPFLTEHAAQLLVQALVISRLDYCNALLAGLTSNTIKPLQMIQNAATRLVFNEPKRAHVTPLFVSLHWLPVAARIQFKTLMLAYITTTGPAPTYFHSLLRIYIPSRSLRSASERRLVVPSQRGSKSLSRTFSFTVSGWWNDLPTPIWNAWIPVNLQATTENSSLST